ncbi:Lrp/AsnC family transcriptional regulator [Actinoplanes sp. CA-054009]
MSTSDSPESSLSELDYQLVTALQVAPRADWQRIGAALGVDGSTAARRWNRLHRSGHAWISCFPAQLAVSTIVLAFIEIDCVAGRLHEVSAEVAQDPHVMTLEHVTGPRDLLVTAFFADHVQLGRYLGFRLGTLPGIASTRTQLAVTVHTEGSRWRLDRLGEGGDQLQPRPAAQTPSVVRPVSADDLRLIQVLAEDPRRPAARIAELVGMNATTVRRRLDRLDAAKMIVYRCEIARYASGWPISVSLWGSVPLAETARVVAQLSGMRETRLCATLSGTANLLLVVWLRSVPEIAAFEARLVARVPELTVIDRAVALWVMKLGGHLLDPHGRNLRPVPLDYWADPSVDKTEDELLNRLRG